MKVIITGSSGMIGKGVLLECLDDTRVEQVLVVNRRSIALEHPKLKEALLQDFYYPDSIREELTGYDVVFFCLGVSAGGLAEADYHRITYDYTLNFAKIFLEQNPGSDFIYVSGTGTDSTEKGRMMWARVKGRTENDLLKMPFSKKFMFRPGMIRPLRGIKSRTRAYRILYIIISPLWPILIAMFGKNITDTTRIGRAMINVIVEGSERVYFENPEINELAKG